MIVRVIVCALAGALLVGCSVFAGKGGRSAEGKAAATFERSSVLNVGTLAFAVEAGDFNGDGDLDLVATDSMRAFLVVFIGNGDGTFAEPLLKSTGRLPRGLAVGDLDNDGDLDVVVAASHANAACVHLGDGAGNFAFYNDFRAGVRPFAVALGDLNEDGLLDVVVANESNVGKAGENVVGVLFGAPDGRLRSRVEILAGQFPADVKIADVNADTHLDVVIANWGGNSASVFLGDGTGSLTAGATVRPKGRGAAYSVQVAELDEDGGLDLALSNLVGETHLFPGRGDGEFGEPFNLPSGKGSRSLAVADFNGDGRLDIASANTDVDSITVTYATAGGGYGAAQEVAKVSKPRWVSTSDIDADGRPDLAAASMTGTVTVLLNR